MADVLSKGESAMPKSSGLKNVSDLSGFVGHKPVLDNRHGASLAKGKQSNIMSGKGKK